MKKRIEDYWNLYMGCDCIVDGDKTRLTAYHMEFQDHDTVKLILRPLSSMTEEELAEVERLLPPDETIDADDTIEMLRHGAEVTRYLLSKHFDLFNLIPDNLAIDEGNK